MTSWDGAKSEAPLKIAITDSEKNSPFSLAFFRGHHAVAKAILEIAQAQYAPEEKTKTRFVMEARDEGDEDYSDNGCESAADSEGSEPRIQALAIGGDFTTENVGQVSMKVNSRTKPLEIIGWACRGIRRDGTAGDSGSPFAHVINNNDLRGLKTLLDWAEHYGSQKLDPDDEPFTFFAFPDPDFTRAVELGRSELLSEIIRRTGAGLPLEDLVKNSGLELKEKPKYYQGLTVYGKKR